VASQGAEYVAHETKQKLNQLEQVLLSGLEQERDRLTGLTPAERLGVAPSASEADVEQVYSALVVNYQAKNYSKYDASVVDCAATVIALLDDARSELLGLNPVSEPEENLSSPITDLAFAATQSTGDVPSEISAIEDAVFGRNAPENETVLPQAIPAPPAHFGHPPTPMYGYQSQDIPSGPLPVGPATSAANYPTRPMPYPPAGHYPSPPSWDIPPTPAAPPTNYPSPPSWDIPPMPAAPPANYLTPPSWDIPPMPAAPPANYAPPPSWDIPLMPAGRQPPPGGLAQVPPSQYPSLPATGDLPAPAVGNNEPRLRELNHRLFSTESRMRVMERTHAQRAKLIESQLVAAENRAVAAEAKVTHLEAQLRKLLQREDSSSSRPVSSAH
jgi:hypothetical protein